MSQAQTIYLKDYQAPALHVQSLALDFNLQSGSTIVTAHSEFVSNPALTTPATQLLLAGEELELVEVLYNDTPLASSAYELSAEGLLLKQVEAPFSLTIKTRIYPEKNTALTGLYQSSNTYCTQCEAHGFRRITYFLDRPDVMTTYTTRIEADKNAYPQLLSNGNLVEQGELDNGRHWVKWHDPHKKPSYLFALVAGKLDCAEDEFVTMSGRKVNLKIFVEPGEVNKTAHAMVSLKQAMLWDEQVYGREYDLDIFMIVAVSDFNMGAMENKGLNIFNAKYILADPATATDHDYEGIASVVAHEYFHNWSGNRVTCRDWFQLSLKEGFTVFRDQEFSADHLSPAVVRIKDVAILRSAQFAEDAGPLAHPVRPESYAEINNFYTLTVYNKGAEVIRMLHRLLGADKFRAGTDLYFERHDGQAVTCDDFVKALEDASQVDLSQFKRWYSQSGTPELKIETLYDANKQTYQVTVEQSCPKTPGQETKQPFYMPLKISLFDATGNKQKLTLVDEAAGSDTERTLIINEPVHSFVFKDIVHPVYPSLLRGFTAPVKLFYDYTDAELSFLMAHDDDGFARYDAAQKLAFNIIKSLISDYRHDKQLVLPTVLVDAYKHLLQNPGDQALLALMLVLPSENYIAEQMAIVDVDAIFHVREFMRKQLAEQLQDEFMVCYQAQQDTSAYEFNASDMGQRALKNACLMYLNCIADANSQALALAQFDKADNMTDSMAALTALANGEHPEREQCLAKFYERWADEALVVDKWLQVQASSMRDDTFAHVQALVEHPAFTLTNPNKVRALLGTFSHANPRHFHREDGAGYDFLLGHINHLDKTNPQVAARLVQAFSQWRRFDAKRQELMQTKLQALLDGDNLSPDVHEIVSKTLA